MSLKNFIYNKKNYFQLRFSPSELEKWTKSYNESQHPKNAELEHRILEEIRKAVYKRGYLTRDEFLDVCRWKSHRPKRFHEANSINMVEQVTKIALSSQTCPELKLKILMTLSGVNAPVATVFLHFFDQEKYPILDFRALWSLKTEVPKQYTFDFYEAYTAACREISMTHNITMRDLDKALWQYSAVNQAK